MWHAFGNLGDWTEWHLLASTMREAVAASMGKIKAYGHALVENPTSDLCWFATAGVTRPLTIRPYKPLQSDWGVGEP